MQYSKVFNATFDSMERLIPWITSYIPSSYIEEKGLHKLELALEELFVNIIQHGYKKSTMPIFISLQSETNHFVCEVRDFATPFNPLKHVHVANEVDIEKQPLGGQGIKIIKAVFDNIDYCFINDMNVIRLKLQ